MVGEDTSSSTEWSDAELKASIQAYREMERLFSEGRPYSKKDFYLGLAERFSRSPKAFEYRMQNISAVLQELNEPWIPGLRPAGNIGKNVRPRIEALLKKFPKLRTKASSPAPYKAKLPAIRNWLTLVASTGKAVTYLEVMEAFGIDRFSLRHALDYLGHEAENADEPILTALIVGKHSRKCGPGFEYEFEVEDDEAERQRLYKFWAERQASTDTSFSVPNESLELKSARFVSVEARPDQAAFRRKVFAHCNGQCVVSGCDVLPTLDAAHRRGRSWRLGHNAAEDGYILRKDIHALYDSNLLHIEPDGTITVDPSIVTQYGHLSGTTIRLGKHVTA